MGSSPTSPTRNEAEMETRMYPICCTSAFCGGYGDSCRTCRNKPVLDEFKAWRERTAAVQKNPIWSRLFWTATREEKPDVDHQREPAEAL